jgi:hypothetical protein
MDLLHIALHGFEQLAPALKAGPTPETSDAVEAWLRGPVCAVAQKLAESQQFRRHALWSLAHLGSRAKTSQRKLVEAVDAALVAAAGACRTAAGDEMNRIDPTARIMWLADRPWHDLVAEDDYFDAHAGLRLLRSRADCRDLFWREPDPRVPLGDYICRCMFRRIDCFAEMISAVWSQALDAARRRGATGFALAEKLFNAKVDLDQAIRTLREACYQGTEARLRDACCALVLVTIAYAPNPDLTWLTYPGLSPEACGQIVRSYVRPVGNVTLVERGVDWKLRGVGQSKQPLCRPDVATGIATALAEVEVIYRRPAESEDLVEWLRQERRLVMVDKQSRVVYWDGEEVIVAWEKKRVVWDFLWKLAQRARQRRPLRREDVQPETTGNPGKHRRHRLSEMLPGSLDVLIRDDRSGGYQLHVKPSEIALVSFDDEFGLVEVPVHVMPEV